MQLWCGSDRKLSPLIHKNLNSHQLRNMKSSLMFAVTVSFLIFTSSSFNQIGVFLTKTSTLLFGADLIFRKIGWGNYMIFDEFEVMKVLEKEHVRNGGIL